MIVGWQWCKQEVAEQIYRERLAAVHHEYSALLERYETLARKTAITELLVENSQVAVVIRSEMGELLRMDTDLNPANEIYVDYIFLEGRLWIRRIFDNKTKPEDGFYLDPRLIGIDWTEDASKDAFGKAVYRQLSPGRWVVTTTGNGALGLALVDADAALEIQQPVQFLPDDQWETALEDPLADITWRDIIAWAWNRTSAE